MIRRTRKTDLSLLGAVETAAASLFREFSELSWLAEQPPIAAETLQQFLADRASFVCCDPDTGIIGFIAAIRHGKWLHIEEVSVVPNAQGRGVGRQLIEAVMAEGRDGNCLGLSLTTYRDIPWNGPWYRKQGFIEQDHKALPTYLSGKLKEEAQSRLCPPTRIAMTYPLG